MKKILLFLFCATFLFSCSDQEMLDSEKLSQKQETNSSSSVQLSLTQAKAYAGLFHKQLDEKSSLTTRSSAYQEPSIQSIDFLIDGKDTLLYAINYAGNNGYILLAGSNNSFPIIAHSNTGNIDLYNIEENNPLSLVIKSYKSKIKKELSSTTIPSDYFEEWKDLGKKGFDYEVEPTNNEPLPQTATRARRKNSSGKKSIYPYTGRDLDYWCQEGGYNYYADHQYPIGCPAIAIGMLMYDTSTRPLGNSQSTYPSFYSSDKVDVKSKKETSLAKKLRQIADSIPNYDYKPSGSGASPDNILIGLHKLGYKKAQLVNYDFETLYKNLSFNGKDYFGKDDVFYRGVLIGANRSDGGGHIWFCDGYYEQSYTVKKKFLGIKIKSWTEYDDRLYMNWGWGPNKGNGWYCATDDIWTSLDNKSQYFNFLPKIFINLSYYEYPAIHH